MSEAERLDLAAVEELESLAEHRRKSAAATRAERAAASRLRLDYRAEAAHYSAAAEIVARDPAAAWAYRLREASALNDHGNEFGDNQALRDAIAVYRAALLLTPRAKLRHSNGRRRRTTSATPSRHSGNARAGRRGSRKRWSPIARHWRNTPGHAFH